MTVGRVLITLVTALVAVPLGAQTLGELAAREKAKREQKARPGKAAPKVFTNADLGQEKAGPEEGSGAAEGARSPGMGESDSPRGGESESGGSETGGYESGVSESDQWEGRVSDARAVLTGARTKVADNQKRIEDLRARLNPTSASYEQDTFEVGGSGLNSRHAALREDLADAESELGVARQELEAAEQAWKDFVREALSAGAPPSLLREPER